MYTIKDQCVGHWILIWKSKKNRENILHYFDPYGTSYLKDLELTHNKDNLTKFLKCYKLIENTHQYQTEKRHINTCIRHIAVRAKFAELDDKHYKTFILSMNYDADAIVCLLTCFYEKGQLNHYLKSHIDSGFFIINI